MASFDFELESFQKNYSLPAIETYYALKRLEEAGFVQLNEGFTALQAHFPVDKKTLYEFQIANAAYDPLIKLVLRMYGGELFTNFWPYRRCRWAANWAPSRPPSCACSNCCNRRASWCTTSRKTSPS
jgi:hypothetical protein